MSTNLEEHAVQLLIVAVMAGGTAAALRAIRGRNDDEDQADEHPNRLPKRKKPSHKAHKRR